MQEFKFEIVRKVGTLSTKRFNGETRNKEVNIISWNGREPRFDIREWDESHAHMSKGVTLTGDEIRTLYELIKPYTEKTKAI